jgi:hypothetical protein
MLRTLILVFLPFCSAPCDGGESTQRLSYLASYQGLLSAGLPLDMALIRLELAPGQAQLSVSTREFGAAELVMPVRFCYRTGWDRNGSLRWADWWSRIGDKASRGQLQVNRNRQRITRLHVELKLAGSVAPLGEGLNLPGRDEPSRKVLDQDLDQASIPAAGVPMERLSMLVWLRRQPLRTGQVLEPAVTNGDHLIGFRIEVEGEERIDWHGDETPSLRVRMEPRFDDDTQTTPLWLWLSRDERRLPLRFRGERALGRFEARLLPPEQAAAPECRIPEAEGLDLPAVPVMASG